MVVRPAESLLAPAVAASIAALPDPIPGLDSGALALANRYAALIDAKPDDAAVLALLGPKLLAALESLGATPRGRSQAKGTPAGSKLAALRAASAR